MSGIKGKLAALAAIAMMAQSETGSRGYINGQEISLEPKEKVIPKGVKEWHFNNEGWICEKSQSVFSCIAINKKSASKKYNNYKLKTKTN